MKTLSLITEKFTESVIREMTRLCNAQNGINLSQGYPDFDSPQEIKDFAIDAIINGSNQYPVTFGEPELRNAISKKIKWFNQLDYDPDDEITVTCGATEAMIASLKAIVNLGDEVIIFQPFYENYGPDAIISGAIPRFIQLHEPEWNFDEDELASLLNNNTKAIIINTPNNPTGKIFSLSELEYIAKLCNQWDLYAITDEIYEHITYDGKKHISIASLAGMRDRTVTINSASKTYSVTGWRVGWAIASKMLTSRIRKVHDFLTVGAPTPFQHASALALNFPLNYYENLRVSYEQKRNYLCDQLTSSGFSPIKPSGAYYIFAGYEKLQQRFSEESDDFQFCKSLLNATGVATVPGASFYYNKSNNSRRIRFCFCKKMDTLKLAIKNIGLSLK